MAQLLTRIVSGTGFIRVPTGLFYSSCVCAIVSSSLQPHGLYPSRLLCPWDSPGKNVGVGCHSLLQGIFPTKKSNLCLLHWQAGSLPLVKKPTVAHVAALNSVEMRWPFAMLSSLCRPWSENKDHEADPCSTFI